MNTTRQDFICGGIAALTALAGTGKTMGAETRNRTKHPYVPLVSHDVPGRNRRPYAGLDWKSCQQITTTSHGHCDDQKMLDAFVRRGYRFLTISNYYPSAPCYPGKTFTRYHYHFHTDYPLMVKGALREGTVDWNRLIDPWKDEIDPQFRGEFPFDPAKDTPLFPNWPEGMLEAPNAEHHQFLGDDGRPVHALHMNGVGSFFKSGTIDKWNRYRTSSNAGYATGCGDRWRTAVDKMIRDLMFADGGGVTINHPTWTNLDRHTMLDILDHDPRVLGCEVMNAGMNSENYWDWALATGRQCFGFFVPDHSIANDRKCAVNILIVPELTVHECLKAYRQGNFYGSKYALGVLRFTGISFDGKTVAASTDKSARLQVVTACGVSAETTGTSVSWTVPVGKDEKNGAAVHVFARIRAFAQDGSGETLWSQPFMLSGIQGISLNNPGLKCGRNCQITGFDTGKSPYRILVSPGVSSDPRECGTEI